MRNFGRFDDGGLLADSKVGGHPETRIAAGTVGFTAEAGGDPVAAAV